MIELDVQVKPIEERMAYRSNAGSKPLLLVFPYDIMAHYLRCIQLAHYLKPWFSVKFLFSARYHSFIKEAGFDTFNCIGLDPVKTQQAVQSFDFSWLNEGDLFALYKAQVDIIDELQPAAVLGDMAPTLKMAAEKTGVSYIALLNGYLSKHYASIRRMPRSHPLYKVFNLLPTSLYQYFIEKGEKMYFEKIHQPFKEIRKRENLSFRVSYADELEGDLNLICDLPELFPQAKLPGNYRFIYPLISPPSSDDSSFTTSLDQRKKTIFVSMGSTGNWESAHFLNHPAYKKYNIVTAGDTEHIVRGRNVFAFAFINNSRLFEKADLVICHGGNGTCYQALSNGIPLLCLSTHFEQDYNIEGLERSGLAKSLNEINSENYPAIIADWIAKKGTATFTEVKNRISTVTAKRQEFIPQMVNEIKQYHVPENRTTISSRAEMQ